MKKLILYLMLGVFLLPLSVQALVTSSSIYKNVNSYLFIKDDCKECEEINQWLEEENSKSPYTQLVVMNIKDNEELYQEVKSVLKIDNDVPLLVIGSHYFIDFDAKEKDYIVKALEAYKTNESCNLIHTIQRKEDVNQCIHQNNQIYQYVPIQHHKWVMPLFTILLGIINALNPIFVLSFLFILSKKKNISIVYLISHFIILSIMMCFYLVLAKFLDFHLYTYAIAILGILLSIHQLYKIIKKKEIQKLPNSLENKISKDMKDKKNLIHCSLFILFNAFMISILPILYTQVLSTYHHSYFIDLIYVLLFNFIHFIVFVLIYNYSYKHKKVIQMKKKWIKSSLFIHIFMNIIVSVLLMVIF